MLKLTIGGKEYFGMVRRNTKFRGKEEKRDGSRICRDDNSDINNVEWILVCVRHSF